MRSVDALRQGGTINFREIADNYFRMRVTTTGTTEAARHLGHYLSRVKHKGEHFLLTKNDQPIAELSPASGSRPATWAEMVAVLARLPRDPTFADDPEKVNEAGHPAANPWA